MSESVPSTTAGPNSAYTYFAFISYKRADEKWARWLKRHLQLYRLPAKTHKKYPSLKRRCSPVFLDKTNLMPGALDSGLSSEVQSARYLIVICSRAAKENSKYLDDELKYFLEGSGDISRVIPFIVDKSDHPVEECFPNYLAELCKTQNIVGVSIYDDGKRSALLRIIAAMLGIKREELESDDLRRRRRQYIATGILALLLLIGGWRSWDYYRTKTEYYLDYTEVYGVPRGISELKETDIRTMCAHYAIVSNRGKVRKLQYENSFGKPIMQSQLGRINHFATAEYEYKGDEIDTVSYFDEQGHIILELHYADLYTIDLMKPSGIAGEIHSTATPLASNSTDSFSVIPDSASRSNIVRYLLSYDESGHVSLMRYASDTYNRVGRDADGISGLRFEHDAFGRVTRILYLTFVGKGDSTLNYANFDVIGKADGEAGLEIVYDEHDDVIEIIFIGADQAPIITKEYGSSIRAAYHNHNQVRFSLFDNEEHPFVPVSGISEMIQDYDARGNTIRTAFYGADGSPTVRFDGVSSLTYMYDQDGNLLGYDYFGVDGQPTLCSGLYASERYTYDMHGYLTVISYFGLDGTPAISSDGYAVSERSYDARGNLVSQSYFDARGNLTLCSFGYAGWKSEYDGNDNEIGHTYFGADGEPTLSIGGIAGWTAEFDVRGNEIKRSYFDADGNPTLHRDGYAIWESDYDERGNKIAVRFYGTNGNPVLNYEGLAGYEAVFDRQGNEIRRSFFGSDGFPVLFNGAYAAWKSVYDVRGNEIQRSFFGLDDQPVLIFENYAGWKSTFDLRGNEIKHMYFGTNGKPIVTDSGYAGWESVYDPQGNEILRRYLGADGKPVLCSEGYAVLICDYDMRGNELLRSYYDTDNNPVSNIRGIASMKSIYDDRGNATQRCYYGVNGQSLPNSEGFAIWNCIYDDRGNIVRSSFYDTDNQPVLNFEGIAGWESVFDESCRETKRTFFGTDGSTILSYAGYAGWESDFDIRGNEVRRLFVDASGAPVNTSDGYACVEMFYDNRDNQINRFYYDAQGQLLGSSAEHWCMVAFDASAPDASFRPLQEYYIIVKLGNWEWQDYDDDSSSNFIDDFHQALFETADIPAEVWYMEYRQETGRYELYYDEFEKGKMGIRIMDKLIPDSIYKEIVEAITVPQERTFPTRATA